MKSDFELAKLVLMAWVLTGIAFFTMSCTTSFSVQAFNSRPHQSVAADQGTNTSSNDVSGGSKMGKPELMP